MMKWIEWIKENWDAPYWRLYWMWKDIRCWCRHNLNRAHFNLVKEAWLSYPFDFSYIYELDKAKLEEMRSYFRKAKWIEQSSYDMYIRELTWAINCLDIIIEEELQPDNVYINKRNWKRFLPYWEDKNILVDDPEKWRQEMFERYPGELRCAKARHLYNKIRLYKAEGWWD